MFAFTTTQYMVIEPFLSPLGQPNSDLPDDFITVQMAVIDGALFGVMRVVYSRRTCLTCPKCRID